MMVGSQIIIVPIIYNNSIKAYFSNKTYSVSIKIRMIQIENNIFLIETPDLTESDLVQL